jgi:hypothetical protein
VLYIHSCPPAVCPHVDWAVAGILGVPVELSWSVQPAAPGLLRGEAGWRARAGTASALAAALRPWQLLRFEVTEEPSVGADGERIMVTPSLGLLRTAMSANGDVLVGEDRLRSALSGAHDLSSARLTLGRLLGEPWDAELEPYRQAGDGTPVRWLTQAG